MDPFIISSLEEIDIVAMGVSDQEHIKARLRCFVVNNGQRSG